MAVRHIDINFPGDQQIFLQKKDVVYYAASPSYFGLMNSNKLVAAREYLRQTAFPNQSCKTRGFYFDGLHNRSFTSLTTEILAVSLDCFIQVDERVSMPADSTKMLSQLNGLPYLPAPDAWPSGFYFVAQIFLQDLHTENGHALLPHTGTLLFFLQPNEMECRVIYYKTVTAEWKRISYPDSSLIDYIHYAEHFLHNVYILSFQRKYIFYIDGITLDIPDEIVTIIQTMLECERAESVSPTSMLAKPFYYQGEIDRTSEFNQKFYRRDNPKHVMLFQTEFMEGHVHFWIDAQSLAVLNFTNAYCTYSGT